MERREIAAERRAIEAARRGDYKPMTELVRQIEICGEFVGATTSRPLSAEAMDLIYKLMTGDHVKPGKTGRPKQTPDERPVNRNLKVHDAAGLFPSIERILANYYPNQKGIRDRAITIAIAIAAKRIDDDKAAKRFDDAITIAIAKRSEGTLKSYLQQSGLDRDALESYLRSQRRFRRLRRDH